MTSFSEQFAARAGQVRRRLGTRALLVVTLLGAGIAAAPLYFARYYHAAPVVAGAALGLCLGAAWLRARRTRWSNAQVALYLDAQYNSHETITTAEEAVRQGTAPDTLTRAAEQAMVPAPVLPALLRRQHALLVLGPLLLAGALLLPLRMPKTAAAAETRIKLNAEGLDRVIALGTIKAQSPEDKAKLDAIAKDAARLKADLEKGLTEQEALDRIGRLQDSIREERQNLGSGERKQGLESASARLDETPQTRKLAEALRNRDLSAFDKEMERLANEREKADRDAAKRALQEAIAQAEKNGAPDVAKALKSELRAFEEREQRNERLRELADAIERMSPKSSELKKKAQKFEEYPSDANAKELADQMEKALAGLSKEEREQLAKNLAKLRQSQQDQAPGAKRSPGQDRAPTDEELEQMLKDLGSKDLQPPEAREDDGLKDGEDAARDTARMLTPGMGKDGAGKPGDGSNPGGTPGNKPGDGDGKAGSSGGAGGHHEDTGTGDHKGSTDAIPSAGDLRSRARTPKSRGTPTPGGFTVLGQGREPGSVTEPKTGDLRSVSGKELRSIDQSDVPAEYRDQIHDYFKP
jgi:hypothetical protein